MGATTKLKQGTQMECFALP